MQLEGDLKLNTQQLAMLQSQTQHATINSLGAEKVRASNCNALKRTATHCNTLQYAATHCNTLQHRSRNMRRKAQQGQTL